MVLYFTSNVVKPPAYIYMGRDKFENEDLIAYGWEEDVWFHVDNLSSAHVYLRLPEGQTWDKIDPALLMDCAQLTKANSIQGNKKNNITVIYTPWANLKKDGSMDTGQVSFHNPREVKKVYVEARENAIVNRLNKTKVEKQPDLRQEQDEHKREKARAEKRARAKEREKLPKPEPKPEKGYGEWNDEDALQASSNQDRDPDFLDDFF